MNEYNDPSKPLPEELYDDELKAVIKANRDEDKGVKMPKAPSTTDPQSLLMQLITARRQAHLTQAALAQKVGMSQSSLARIEAGKVSPTLKTLQLLTDATGTRLVLQRNSN